jgi:uncharacterized protein (TIGR02300 family)
MGPRLKLAFDTDATPVYGRPDFTKTEEPYVAREELGTKRVCPETGKKFYDLSKDPVVSPYTGKSYPLSFFVEVAPVRARRETAKAKVVEEEAETEEEVEEEDEAAPELISLEDAEEDEAEDTVDNDDEEELPDLPDDVEIEVEEEDDEVADPFLEEEEDDDDLSDVIGDVDGEEEV